MTDIFLFKDIHIDERDVFKYLSDCQIHSLYNILNTIKECKQEDSGVNQNEF